MCRRDSTQPVTFDPMMSDTRAQIMPAKPMSEKAMPNPEIMRIGLMDKLVIPLMANAHIFLKG